MLTKVAPTTKAVPIVQPEKPKEYTINELADLLSGLMGREITYSKIRTFIKRHNHDFPEAKIIPVQRTLTGRKIFIKAPDAAIIRDGFLHPERSEHPAWEQDD